MGRGKLNIGLNISPVQAPELLAASRRAEELGFGALFIGEHFAVPVHLKTPYPGKVGYNAMTYQYEPYVALGHIAAVTNTVRLGTGISILPLREVFETARAIATVDVLSGGRLDLAVGVGSIPDEFEIMGFDIENRGARMDEMIEIFTRLFNEEHPSYEGKIYNFREIGFEPKPVQKPRPPIFMGAVSKAGLKRTARMADGWYGAVYSPDDAAEVIAGISRHLVDIGRDPATFRYQLIHAAGEPIMPTADECKRYAELGVETLIVSPFSLVAHGAVRKIEEVARELDFALSA